MFLCAKAAFLVNTGTFAVNTGKLYFMLYYRFSVLKITECNQRYRTILLLLLKILPKVAHS